LTSSRRTRARCEHIPRSRALDGRTVVRLSAYSVGGDRRGRIHQAAARAPRPCEDSATPGRRRGPTGQRSSAARSDWLRCRRVVWGYRAGLPGPAQADRVHNGPRPRQPAEVVQGVGDTTAALTQPRPGDAHPHPPPPPLCMAMPWRSVATVSRAPRCGAECSACAVQGTCRWRGTPPPPDAGPSTWARNAPPPRASGRRAREVADPAPRCCAGVGPGQGASS